MPENNQETLPGPNSRRIFFDISSIARWLGPPVGIMRREHELALHVLSKRPDIQLSFFDGLTSSFRSVNPAWVERLVGCEYAIDMVTLDVRRLRGGLSKLRPSRYPLAMALERWRLTADRPAVRHAADLAQRLLWLTQGLPPPFSDRQGSRFGVVPTDLALGAPLELGRDVTIASVGDDWFHKDAGTIGQLKHRHGFRYVVMCHDLIPIMFPGFYPERDVTLFRRHWTTMFPIADRILVNSRRVETDIRDFCGENAIGCGKIVLVQPGFDVVRANPDGPLPGALRPGKFVLFVATIEPRKGHAMLVGVWRRLVAEGLPQRFGVKLVLVGRPGWLVGDLLRQIADARAFEGTLLHFSDLNDDALACLYQAAAFCVLPSLYEGFGLPVVEAFAHGKAVIASTGGSLPEIVGTFSPCLSPTDPDAWFAMMKHWIEDDSVRAAYEEKIRTSFRHPTWDQAAAKIFEVVDAVR